MTTEEALQEIKANLCPKCQYYVNKKAVFVDYSTDIPARISLGYAKDCKFNVTGKEWVCRYEEKNGNCL